MSQFIQLHLLTSYPPSNLNRDDLGRPKTATMGGAQRLRVSSQSLKRAWRTSEVFQTALSGHVGTRTKSMGQEVLDLLTQAGVSEKTAQKAAHAIADVFGKVKKDSVVTDQLVHFSPEEQDAVMELAETLAKEQREPTEDELLLLRQKHRAADIGLFGRMLAAAPSYNIEAAAQVAHAITVHETAVEDDFFSAVDDLNRGVEDVGAGHLGEIEFGAGLFYLYLCIDRDLLVENLSGDADLAERTLRALVEAAATVAPSGKQATFASRAYASFILAEKGRRQPRSLSVAFLKPVSDEKNGYLAGAIQALRKTREDMDAVYDPVAEAVYELDATAPEGELSALLDFVAEPLPEA